MALLLAAQRDFARTIGSAPSFSGDAGIGENSAATGGPTTTNSVQEFLGKIQIFWISAGLGLGEAIGVQIASIKLIGTAGIWFRALQVLPVTFEEFSAALVTRFQPPDAPQVAADTFVITGYSKQRTTET